MPELAARPDVPSDLARRTPMTSLQLAYLAGREPAFELGGTGTHTYAEFEIDAPLDEVRQAVNQLTARHEALRLIFERRTKTQYVLPDPGPVPVRLLDLRGLPPGERDDAIARLREEQGSAARDPETWPLFGVTVVRYDPDGEQRHGQLLCLDLDGLSLDLSSVLSLQRELLELLRAGPASLDDPGLARTSSDEPVPQAREDSLMELMEHVRQQAAGRSSAAAEFWDRRVPVLPPPPRLPLRNAPTAGAITSFTTRRRRFTAHEHARITRLARSAGVSEAAFWLAALSDVLAGHSAQRHFSVLVPCSIRHLLPPGQRNVLGPFSSFVPVGIDWEAAPLQDRLRRLRTSLLLAVSHHAGAGVELMTHLAARHGRPGRSVLPVVLTVAPGQDDAGPPPDEPVFTTSQTAQVYLDCRVFSSADGGVRVEMDSVDEVTGPELAENLLSEFLKGAARLADELEAGTPVDAAPPADTALASWEPCVAPRGALETVLAASVTECTGYSPVGRDDPLLTLTHGTERLDALVLTISDRLAGTALTRMDLLTHRHIAHLAEYLEDNVPHIDTIAQASLEADQAITARAGTGEDPQ